MARKPGPRKPEPLPFEEAVRFQDAIDSVGSNLREVLRVAKSRGKQGSLMSSNFKTAIRGLDYIDKFVVGLAAHVVQSGDKTPLQILREAHLGEDQVPTLGKLTEEQLKDPHTAAVQATLDEVLEKTGIGKKKASKKKD